MPSSNRRVPADISSISSAIQARHLQFPMAHAITAAPGDSANEVGALLAARQFDACPVLEDGHVLGIFQREEGPVSTTVQDSMCQITARNLTAADTPLELLVEDLGRHSLIFVLEGREIAGFVTPADLGSAAARTYFYLKLAALEVAAADYLRQRYPHQEDALSALSNGRRSKAQELVASLLADDAFIDIVASLSLQDLVSVLGKDEPFRARIRESGIGWDSLSHGLVGFRNDIMHPSRPFGGATRKGAQGLSKKLRGLTTLTGALISLRQLNVPLP